MVRFPEFADGIPCKGFKEFAEMRRVIEPQVIPDLLDAFAGKKRQPLGFKDQPVPDILLGRLMNGRADHFIEVTW